MKNIKFNMRAVPRAQRSDETLVEMIEEYTEKLQDKDWKWALCIHEAAHAVYAEKFGSEQAIFEAPLAFSYNISDGLFMLDEAQVWIDPPTYWRDDVKQMLAGDVVQRALAPTNTTLNDEAVATASEADGGDYYYVCAALKRGRVPKAQWASFIKRVESEIRKDLRNPALRKAIEQRAKTYLRILNKRIKALPRAA